MATMVPPQPPNDPDLEVKVKKGKLVIQFQGGGLCSKPVSCGHFVLLAPYSNFWLKCKRFYLFFFNNLVVSLMNVVDLVHSSRKDTL